MAGAAASVAGGSLFGFASLIWDITTNPHPWLNSLLEGAKARARSSDCDLVLLVGRGDRAFIGRCEQNDAKGVIYHAYAADEPRIRPLLEAGIPCVAVDAPGVATRLGHVGSDNFAAAVDAVRHLHELGRRRIAILSAVETGGTTGEQRLLGYRSGLEQVGLPFRDDYVVEGDFFHRSGLGGMRALLALSQPPDAVFAVSDTMAIGAVAAIERAGLRVPDDVAVIGFDDIEQAKMLSPQLTTLRQDVRGLGVAAVESLLRMIEDPDAEPPEVMLPCELVVRESCGARRSGDSSSAARVSAASGAAQAGVIVRGDEEAPR